MKPYQVIVIVIAVVVLNNVLLLSILGYFSEKPLSVVTQQQPTQSNSVVTETYNSNSVEPVPARETKTQLIEDSLRKSDDTLKNPEAAVLDTVRQFFQSKDFIKLMDEYQVNASPRFARLGKRYQNMSGSDILLAVRETDSQFEKELALSVLAQGKMSQLSISELKGLYQELGAEDWIQSRVLMRLMDEGDSESIEWAKQLISSKNLSNLNGTEVLSSLYEHDSNFIEQYLSTVEFDQSYESASVVSFVASYPELAKKFYAENFERLLESNNTQIYQMGGYGMDFEMSDRQQTLVAEFFSSTNRHKRGYAIGLISNMDSVDLLRDGYSSLKRVADKRRFLNTLRSAKKGSEKRSLFMELVRESDDPNIKALIR